jgi:hypothetical protein
MSLEFASYVFDTNVKNNNECHNSLGVGVKERRL